MKIIQEILLQYMALAICSLLTALAGYFASKIKGILESSRIDEAKRNTVNACIRAVEQLYKDLDGEEKLKKAKQSIIEILAEKGIGISANEMEILIEAEVNSL